MKKILLSAAIAAATIAPAYGQELPHFGGAKIGVLGGYDRVRLSLDGESGSKDGVLYGVTAGYDFDLGAAVIGIEGEASDSTTKETITDVLVFGDEASLAATRDLYIGARIGLPVSPTLLLYAKAGYTSARFKLSYSDGFNSGSESDNLDGYRIGGGAELTSGKTFARVEYRYSDYGNYMIDDFGTDVKVKRHQVAVTAGFRF